MQTFAVGGEYLQFALFVIGCRHMPVISEFYGMIIKMYFQQAEHNPPRIHVVYNGTVGVFNIRTGEMMEGDLPVKGQRLVTEWLDLHRAEVQKMGHATIYQSRTPELTGVP
ncbi:MAG: DUF4160 domain-containing protein [Verrucomicrobiales bacterium]|nr:DUF4160 domain-containing protein [Verrucomicrobiales bacterium]